MDNAGQNASTVTLMARFRSAGAGPTERSQSNHTTPNPSHLADPHRTHVRVHVVGLGGGIPERAVDGYVPEAVSPAAPTAAPSPAADGRLADQQQKQGHQQQRRKPAAGAHGGGGGGGRSDGSGKTGSGARQLSARARRAAAAANWWTCRQ